MFQNISSCQSERSKGEATKAKIFFAEKQAAILQPEAESEEASVRKNVRLAEDLALQKLLLKQEAVHAD